MCLGPCVASLKWVLAALFPFLLLRPFVLLSGVFLFFSIISKSECLGLVLYAPCRGTFHTALRQKTFII